LNYRNIGLVLLIPSTIVGIIVLGMNSYLPNGIELPIPLLYFSIINGAIWIIGIVLVNYKVKHSGRASAKFRRTNTKRANDV